MAIWEKGKFNLISPLRGEVPLGRNYYFIGEMDNTSEKRLVRPDLDGNPY
jgi:hypothetical protein